MKKIFTLFLVFMTSIPIVLSHDFYYDGIYYNKLGGDSVEVTYRGDDYLFRDDEYSGNVTIPAKADGYRVTAIGEEAFRKCETLTSVTIPNSVTSIGDRAFYDCSSLSSITIPNSVTSIGRDAFTGCTSIKSIKWNAKQCVFINNQSPFYCIRTQIKSFVFGDSVQIIPHSICMDMENLESIVIPNSVTSIEENAFKGCSSLSSITIPNSVTSIGYRTFYGCSSLSSITIPNSVTSIGSTAFYGCSSLSSITIPNSVTEIGGLAFSGCSSLSSITIPNSVTYIGFEAFNNCSNLNTLYSHPETPPSITEDAFSGTDLTKIYVRTNSVDIYKEEWSSYADIIFPMVGDANFTIESLKASLANIKVNLINAKENTVYRVGYIFKADTIYHDCEDSVEFTITGLRPNDNNEVTFFVGEKDGNFEEYLFTQKTITTSEVKISASSNIQTPTAVKISVNCDFADWTPGDYGIILTHPDGISDTIKFEPNQTDTIVSNLIPNTEYSYLGFCKIKEYDDFYLETTEKKFKTKDISVTAHQISATQTTMRIGIDYDFGDATFIDKGIVIHNSTGIIDTISFIGERKDTLLTNINGDYCYIHGYLKTKEYGLKTEPFKEFFTKEISIKTYIGSISQTTMRASIEYDYGDATLVDKGIIVYHPTDVIDTISFEGERKDTLLTNLRVYDKYYIQGYVKTKERGLKLSMEKEAYTKNINASLTITNRTQTTMSVSASIDLGDAKDYGKNGIHWIIGSSSFNDNYIEIFFDEGVYNLDTTFTDLSTEITCAFRVFYQGEDNGEEYYAYGSTRSSKTLPITLNEPELVDVGQTYIEVSSNNVFGDATLYEEYIEVTTNKDKTSEYKVDINGRNKIIINNLDPFTRYYFRSVLITKEDGTMQSKWYEAKTKAISLSTGIADGISNSSAFLHGTIECDSLSRTEIGFEWKRSDAPSTVKPQRLLVVDRIDENLLFRLEGLSSDHYYDFRTFCYYNDKSYYGEWVGFLTSDKEVLIAPSVSTLKAESSELGVEMKGFIVAGTEVILQRGFECWRDGTDVVATTVAEGSVINSFIPEPWSYTTYKYRAYAKTPAGTTYGETLEVTTEYIKTKIPEIAIKPSSNSANVTWKNIEQADYYMLSLYDDPSMTNSRGIYTVDKNGNITQKRSTSSVVTCNLTDLLPDTNYYFAVKAYNSSDQMVAEETGTFETTPMETPIDEVKADEEISEVKVQKILHNGHIYIIHNGKVYNILGEEVNLQFCR